MRILNGLGDSQQLIGAQMLLANGNGRKRKRSATKKKRTAAARVKKRGKVRAKAKPKLVKGSAAAKAYMARLRKMRK
jgi:hypothetical protein